MQLFINTPGTYLHVKDEMFEVRKKVEKEVEKHQFSARKVSSILLSKGAALSTDAIALALKHNIDVVFLENNGYPFGRVWHSKLGSTTKIRKRQLEASLNQEGLEAVKDWLGQKLENQATFLPDLKKHRSPLQEFLEEKLGKIGEMQAKIMAVQGETCSEVADSIRGWEGTAGRMYFEALSKSLPEKHQFPGRSSRPAQNPFNAFLNYAYGMLYGSVEKSLMIAGLDPYVGFLHRDDYNQKSLVFDFIEPYRIHAERVVFRLFSGKKVNKDHTSEITNGVSLNEQGKPLLVEAFNAYFLEDKVRHKGRNLSRQHAMQLEAHRFAQKLLKADG